MHSYFRTGENGLMAEKQMDTPRTKEIKKLAQKQDRFGIFRDVFQYSTAGMQRICDAKGLGPANAKEWKFSAKDWDAMVGRRSNENNRCKGAIFHSFRRKHFHRRCDAVTDGDLCPVCVNLRKAV